MLKNYLPPQALDAEMAVLGAILFDNKSIKRALKVLRDGDFYKESHRELFRAMETLIRNHQPIDIVTLTDYCKAHSILDKVGGIKYLSDLANSVPTSANVKYHAEIVKDKSMRRLALQSCIKTAQHILDGDELDDILPRHKQTIAGLRKSEGIQIVSAADIAQKTLQRIERRYDSKEYISGVPFGFRALDELSDGLQPGEFTIIGARPGMGKTIFAMTVAKNAAMAGFPIGAIHLEMMDEQLGIRAYADLSDIDLWRIKKAFLQREDWKAIHRAAATFAELPIYCTFQARKESDVEQVAIEMIETRGVKLLIIDYLQLMESKDNSQNREREVSGFSKMFKRLANDYGIPTVALSQLNRKVEERPDKRPMKSDLRDSGSLEQDADNIIFLYRDDYYYKDSKKKGIVEVIWAKGRNTETETVELAFNGKKMQFRDLETGHTETEQQEEMGV